MCPSCILLTFSPHCLCFKTFNKYEAFAKPDVARRGLRTIREQRVGPIFMGEAFWTNPRRVRPKKNESLHYTATEAPDISLQIIRHIPPACMGRDSHSLRAGRSGDRIPVGGEIFRTRPDQPWGPPSLLYNRYRVSPRGKADGAWRWPTPSSAEVKERVELHLYSPYGPSWFVVGWTLLLPSFTSSMQRLVLTAVKTQSKKYFNGFNPNLW